MDSTLEASQNARFRIIYHDLINKMPRRVSLTEKEVTCILMVYYKLLLNERQSQKHINKQQMVIILEILHIVDSRYVSRILDYFGGATPLFKAEAFVKMIAFFANSTFDQQLEYCFTIYSNFTPTLNRGEVTYQVNNMLIGSDDDDEIVEMKKDMVDMLFLKFDLDKDHVISYDEYKNAVYKQPLLMQFLGKILPPIDLSDVIAFVHNISSKMKLCFQMDESN